MMTAKKQLTREGPIFLTTNAVRGEPLMRELKENIKKMKDENFIRFYLTTLFIYTFKILSRHDCKLLILSGSHGTEDGKSGLTVKDSRNVDEEFGFYKEDCDLLRIKPGPHKRSTRSLPLKACNGIPEITNLQKKLRVLDQAV